MQGAAVTVMVGHRGDPLLLRENTLPSIASAVVLGADWVEVDTRLTRDGVPVLLHDDTLTRLWGHDRRVDSLTRAELGRLTGGGEWEVPTLREALRLTAGAGVPLMIDVIRVAEAYAATDLVRSLGCVEAAVFTGKPEALAAVREAVPEARIAMSWESPLPARPALWQRVRPDYFNLYHRWATPRRIARMHRRGVRVSVWTVDDAPTAAALAAAGVDVIITNDLRMLRRVLGTDTSPSQAS